MKTINLTFCKSTGFDPFFDDVKKSITIQDEPFGGGGFGDIYHAVSFDGKKSPIPQVVKVFKDDNKVENEKGWNTIQLLQSRIMEEKAKIESDGKVFLDEYPALAAMPQVIFEGKLGNRKVLGHVTLNLIKMGLVSFEKVLESKDLRDKYISRDSDDRAIMAYQFAKGFALLHKVKYIHADINEDNLFIGEKEPLCVILDYDSGAVIQNVDDNPTTIGKNRSWTAPEVLMKLADNWKQRIEMTHWMDLWSIANALHYVLMGLPPTYLKTMSKTSYSAYIKKYPDWPTVDPKDAMFKDVASYELLINMINNYELLSKRMIRLFRSTFIDGFFQPAFRTSVEDWANALKKEVDKLETKYESPKWTEARKFVTDFPVFKASAVPPKKEPPIGDPPGDENLNDYVNELLPDLINGSQKLSLHKPFILKMANESGKDGNKYLEELTDFLDLFKECVKDKKITRLEYNNMLLQAQLLGVAKDTLDKLLKPYKILK